MRIGKYIVAFSFSLACSAIALGCASSSGSELEEHVERQSQALRIFDPGGGEPDPIPECEPDCTNRACGASDGCGGSCTAGSCPTGTVCGGGGRPGVCACLPNCAPGQACGAPDGCGGVCSGYCGGGLACGAGGVPGVCAPIPMGQGVECFVFDDGYRAMAGPSGAVFFSGSGQACIPDGTSTGLCRRWFGRCQTTDPSHTPVSFRVGRVYPFLVGVEWSAPSDAVLSHHYDPGIFSPNATEMCIPDGTVSGYCGDYFGDATLADGRSVRCRLFEDGGALMTNLTNRMTDVMDGRVWGEGLNGISRKWFGACEVGGCGDGTCTAGESHASCPSDCTCGNGMCENSEDRFSCPSDCTCGDGVCNNGETASSCADDCGPRCGDSRCDTNETCSSCSADCGACVTLTCSGAPAEATATNYLVAYEDANSCGATTWRFANTRSEAESCVSGAGGTVVSNPVVTSRFFHTDPTYGCSSLEVPSFSEESATRCARAQGYAYSGPCP